MKLWCFIFLCCALGFPCFAQVQDIDSLKQALAQTREDKDKVIILSSLSLQYIGIHADSALLLAQQALDLARNINFTRGEAWALYNVGYAYRILGDIPNSMRTSLQGVQLAEEHGFRQEAARCNYNIGLIYLRLLNDYPKALSYLKRANQWNLPVQDAVGESRQFWIYLYFGNVYEGLNMPDSATFYYNKALAHTAIDTDTRLAFLLNFKGLLQLKLKNYPEALAFLKQAIAKKRDHRISAEIYFNLATCFREMGQIDSCTVYAKNSLAEAQRIGFQQYILKPATLLAEIYENENKAEALRFYKIAKLANDEVYGEQKVQDLQRIITEDMQRQREAEREKTAYRNRVRQLALLSGLAVVLLVAFLLYRNNWQKQKSNARLEAQNRELEIEASLERVRAEAMAMNKPDDLLNISEALYTELKTLGIDEIRNAMILIHDEKNDFFLDYDFSSIGGKISQIPNKGFYLIEKYLKELKENAKIKEGFLEFIVSNEELEAWKRIRKATGQLNDPRLDTLKALYYYHYSMGTGNISISTFSPLSKERLQILERFRNVFQLPYQRYLDIEAAAAQVREVQIEAALERVRSRSMGMQSSRELSDLVEVVYQQFNSLKIANWGARIMLMHPEEPSMEIWLSENDQKVYPHSFFIRGKDTLFVREQWEGWHSNKEQFSLHLFGEKKQEYDDIIFERHDYRLLPDVVKAAIRQIKEAYFSFSRMQYGFLVAISVEGMISSEGMMVLARFANVFEQTYTRFLDLLKAETRAVEVARAAALDRVRGEIASMRTTDDLQLITPLIWRELTTLGVPFFRCGLFIMDETNQKVHSYLSTPEGKSLAVMHLPFDGAETTQQTVEHWRRQEVYIDFWDKGQFVAWVQSMTEQGYVQEEKTYQGGDHPPESLSLQFVPFTQGMLYVGSAEPLSKDQITLVKTIADAFAVAYARYEDFTKLDEAKKRVEATLAELKATQAQLIQSEKLASLGELTAGIAHEIQNPLNFVNNFAEVSAEMLDEMHEELEKGDTTEAIAIATDLKTNLSKINHHGQRASSIVKGMLEHSRASTGVKEPTDLNALADEYLRLAYHGLKAKDNNFNAKMETHFDPNLPKVSVIPQDIGRVLLNLINNAFYAVSVRASLAGAPIADAQHPGAREGRPYEPTVTVSTKRLENAIEIRVKDNGNGIPEAIKDKIFQPFFTTKPTGQGTGLGLSLAYEIVTKGHGGTLEVDSTEGSGTVFTLKLPQN